MMNVQEMFDKAYKGVITQGDLSRTSQGTCKYRMKTVDGKVIACGVGHLIDDETATAFDKIDSDDGTGITTIIGKHQLPEKYAYFANHVPFLHELQHAHDDSHSIVTFKTCMEELAGRFDLKVPS